jgi:hypothetical protein
VAPAADPPATQDEPLAGYGRRIPFDVTGTKAGSFTSDAAQTSDQTPGTTIVSQAFTITK